MTDKVDFIDPEEALIQSSSASEDDTNSEYKDPSYDYKVTEV